MESGRGDEADLYLESPQLGADLAEHFRDGGEQERVLGDVGRHHEAQVEVEGVARVLGVLDAHREPQHRLPERVHRRQLVRQQVLRDDVVRDALEPLRAQKPLRHLRPDDRPRVVVKLCKEHCLNQTHLETPTPTRFDVLKKIQVER